MTLEAGKKAPLFTIKTQKERDFSLADAMGKKVILYFYPKDNTPGCTQESCDFKEAFDILTNLNVDIIGVSKDNVTSHKKFAEKYNLPFPLGADIDRSVLEAYGVWIEKKLYGRTYMGIDRATFLIDENGKIEKIWRHVKVKNHVKEILDYLKRTP